MQRASSSWGSIVRIAGVLLLLSTPAFTDEKSEESEEAARFRAARQRMVEQDIAGKSMKARTPVLDVKVLEAMLTVERHKFVPPQFIQQAYADRPLPIGHGQTISQPYIVAFMTELLKAQPDHTVLEIGAGSGYQAAILAKLVKHVYTIEIVKALGETCSERLKESGFDNVEVRIGDGYHGWPEQAPFDAIIVTAAASHIPPPLIEQLKPGGRMIIPVGPPMMTQNLMVVEKDMDSKVTQRSALPVRFVPLTRTGN